MSSKRLITLELLILSLVLIAVTSGFRFNGSCSNTIECLPRETFMRCVRGRCLCAADSEYDFRNGYCRLKINVKCALSGKSIQPCVRGAFCDPPTFADGSTIQGASTGNCKCYQGETNVEDGTCSAAAASLQRSFGPSSYMVSASFHFLVIITSIFTAMFGQGFPWGGDS